MEETFFVKRLLKNISIPEGYVVAKKNHKMKEGDMHYCHGSGSGFCPIPKSDHGKKVPKDKYCLVTKKPKKPNPKKAIKAPNGYELVPEDSEETIQKDWRVWNRKYDSRWSQTYDYDRSHKSKATFLLYAKPIKKKEREMKVIDEKLKLKKQMIMSYGSIGEIEIPFGYYVVPSDSLNNMRTNDLLYSRLTREFTHKVENDEVGNITSGKICVIRPCDKENPPFGYEIVENDSVEPGCIVFGSHHGGYTWVKSRLTKDSNASMHLRYAKPIEEKLTLPKIPKPPKSVPSGYEIVERQSAEIIKKDWKYYNFRKLSWTNVQVFERETIGKARVDRALDVHYMIKPIEGNKVLEYDMVKREEYNKLKNLKKDHENLAHEYKELLTKYDKLEENHEILQDENYDLESDKDYIQEQYDEVVNERDELEDIAKERDELREEYNAAIEERSELQTDAENFAEQCDDMEILYEASKEAFNDYKVKAQKRIRELEEIADKHYKDAMIGKYHAKDSRRYQDLWSVACKTINEQIEKEKSQKKRNAALVDTVKSLVKKYSKYARIYKGLCIISDDSGMDGHFDEKYAYVSPFKPELHGSLNKEQEELLTMLGFKVEDEDVYMYDLRSDEEKKEDSKKKFDETIAKINEEHWKKNMPQPLDMNCPHCETKLTYPEGLDREKETMACGECGKDIGWSDEYGYLLIVDPIEEDDYDTLETRDEDLDI